LLTLDSELRVVLSAALDGEAHTPSVNMLMKSAAATRPGRVVGILLTGMGDDGADGMVELRRGGSMTIAQSEGSCAVYGMPRVANERGGVRVLLSLDEIGALFAGAGISLKD
jgi:two-component system chemotaxis response regulator CheB